MKNQKIFSVFSVFSVSKTKPRTNPIHKQDNHRGNEDLKTNNRIIILAPADVMGEDYPSETFRLLKNKEIKEYGEYRTQQLVLEAFDALAEVERQNQQRVANG